jgi:hypothetical protein
MKGVPPTPNVAHADNEEGEGASTTVDDTFLPCCGGEGRVARTLPGGRSPLGAPPQWRAGAATRPGVPRGLSTPVLRWRTACGRICRQTRLGPATFATSARGTARAWQPCLGVDRAAVVNRAARRGSVVASTRQPHEGRHGAWQPTFSYTAVRRANAAPMIGICRAWIDLKEGRDDRTPEEDAGGVHGS